MHKIKELNSKPGLDFPGFGVGLVIKRGHSLLLYRRANPPEAGHWNIVGGKVDHMEKAIDAARREAEEESGLTIGSIHFLGLSEHIIEEDQQHWISMIYVTEDFAGEPQIMEPTKLPECGWFDMDALPEPLSRFTKDAVRFLRG